MSRKLDIFNEGKYIHMVVFFWHHLLGAMLRTLAIFMRGKYVHMVTFFGITSWGRCWENRPFSKMKIRSHGSILFLHHLLGAMLKHKLFRQHGGRCDAKWRVSKADNGFAGVQIVFALGALGGDVKIFWTKFLGEIFMKWSTFKEYNHVTSDSLNEISGGDLDEMIDFQD